MDNNRSTKVLVWNVRGMNSQEKGMPLEVRLMRVPAKLSASKKQRGKVLTTFTSKNFAQGIWIILLLLHPLEPLEGLSLFGKQPFYGTIVQTNSYAIIVKFHCRKDNKIFHVSNIYGPSSPPQKMGFFTWLMNLDTADYDDWLLARDFNLIRGPDNKNKQGGDLSEMNMFNELISDLDLAKTPFSGRSFTWSNMQTDPLMVKLDWVFTSPSWALSFPATFIQPLSKPVSDHIPYVIHIGSSIPKSNLLRFENHWVQHPGFLEIVDLHWNNSPFYANAARSLSAKIK